MSHLRIPLYTSGVRVSEDHAKQDKLSLGLDSWFIGPADEVSLAMFFSALCELPVHAPLNPLFPVHQPWFYMSQRGHGTLPLLKIRQGGSGRGLRPGRPLITGVMRVRSSTASGGLQARRLSLRLQINPTRFVHHQPPAHWIERRTQPVAEWDLPPPVLHSSLARSADLDERSLDGNDNLLLGRIDLTFGRPAAWQLHLQRYWVGVLQTIENIFHDAARTANVAIEPHVIVNLREMETYWEMRVADPVTWVRQIAPSIMAMRSRASTREYPTSLAEEGREENSRSIKVMLAAGVFARVYAKTNHRVRFEIVHDLTEATSVLNGGHTSSNPDMLLEWLGSGASDAAVRVNEILSVLERVNAREGSQLSVTQLLVAVLDAVKERKVAEEILQLLVANQSVSAPAGSSLLRHLKLLERRRILVRTRPRSGPFELTPSYLDARSKLARFEGLD